MSETSNQPHVDLTVAGSAVRLLGTAHVSRASATAVHEEIASGAYDAVAIELCGNRYRGMVDPDALGRMDLFEVIRGGKAPMVTAMLAMGAFQQRIAEQFGIEPGAEMRAAIDGARSHDLELHLIDRDIGTTLRRIYANVPWYKRLYLFSGLFASVLVNEDIPEEDIEALKEGDLLESTFAQFADSAGPIYLPLIDERDRYMALKLRALAVASPGRILAVVGAGHLKGIARYLGEDAATDPAARLAELETSPTRRRWYRVIPWLIVALVFAGFALGFARSPELGLRLVTEWVVINGGLAALGCLIAGAHPLTTVTGFLAAPLTSLNPTIGAGMVTALVEAWLRKPTVADFARLRSDTTSLRGWRHNRVARTFLVFFLSTLGSAIGTYVAGFRIFDHLVG
ncbi:MAG: TraB/GumN family protein [Gammaproteobacteria bacterium]|nr:TraB/GumN family protein [Gammaproteobacteria bacterium]MCP5199463.1 TraB/GumN family protein [Gammaproteobacteria bacterium]